MCEGGAACECREAEVPAFQGDIKDVWDDIGAPANETEMLRAAVKYPGIDPYVVASGSVRMSAVDRWCNNLMSAGYIIGWYEDDGRIWIWATEEGKAMIR